MMIDLINRLLPKEKRLRMALLMIVDALVVTLSSFLGNFIRFDMNLASVPQEYWAASWRFLPAYIAITILSFFLFHLYNVMWTMAGSREAVRVILACGIATVGQITGMTLLNLRMHRSFYVICFTILLFMTSLIRFSYRILQSLSKSRTKKGKNIVIVGAGEAGSIIAREIMDNHTMDERVACFIDDNPNKKGKYMHGIKIEGDRDKIPMVVEKYKPAYLYVAMPNASAANQREIIKICQETGVHTKVLPGIYQLLSGEVSVSKMRDVQIEDLLGREPISTNIDEIARYIRDKIVLVTGGGGSIGSELCRQIANHRPQKLIVFDIYENNVYDLQQELKNKYPEDMIEYLIGTVRNEHRVESIFERYRPQIVFHAAAHKHVPLMESSPNEAIKNNVFGTLHVAQAADKFGAERFVLISTDKAVNPTNVMGASKRICEMIIQMMERHSRTNFVAVRFGNVLGSNGSVIPLFKKQIEAGGPVTVTHPEIIRYFMTIPEAVSLVLQAGAYARGGEIFVLNMGNPVKILDLAKNLIRLSGYEPDEDIKIEFTGLRPGEKLYEELLMDEEGLKETPNRRIFIGQPIEFNDNEFKGQLAELETISETDYEAIRWVLKRIVPTYAYPEISEQKGDITE